MSYGKDRDKIRIGGGNNVYVKFGASPSWENLGEIVSAKFTGSESEIEISLADNDSFDLPGKRKMGLELVLAQSGKDEIELGDSMGKKGVPVYFYNGKLPNGDDQGFFLPEARVIITDDLSVEGDTHQTVMMKLSVVPQSGVAQCIPDTDLPAGTPFSGAVPVLGKNPFRVVLEQTPA